VPYLLSFCSIIPQLPQPGKRIKQGNGIYSLSFRKSKAEIAMIEEKEAEKNF
jgi:hypothetical protein